MNFYAGAPLHDPRSNLPLELLCVIDHQAREISDAQIQALKALSSHVTKLLDLRLKVDELQSANEREAIQKVAFENMSEGYVLQDHTGAIIDFNSAAFSLLGVTAEEILGMAPGEPDWRAIRDDGSPFPWQDLPALVALRTGLPQKGVVVGFVRKNQEPRWLSIMPRHFIYRVRINQAMLLPLFLYHRGAAITPSSLSINAIGILVKWPEVWLTKLYASCHNLLGC